MLLNALGWQAAIMHEVWRHLQAFPFSLKTFIYIYRDKVEFESPHISGKSLKAKKSFQDTTKEDSL